MITVDMVASAGSGTTSTMDPVCCSTWAIRLRVVSRRFAGQARLRLAGRWRLANAAPPTLREPLYTRCGLGKTGRAQAAPPAASAARGGGESRAWGYDCNSIADIQDARGAGRLDVRHQAQRLSKKKCSRCPLVSSCAATSQFSSGMAKLSDSAGNRVMSASCHPSAVYCCTNCSNPFRKLLRNAALTSPGPKMLKDRLR